MEELIKRHLQLTNGLSRLRYMADSYQSLLQEFSKKQLGKKEAELQENELIVHRDALIKRFEFCYDLIWKFYKLLLVKEYAIDVASPKKVFQEGYQQNIFTKEDIEVLFEIIDARNETTHVYDEMVAETISKKILMFTPFLEKLLKKIHL